MVMGTSDDGKAYIWNLNKGNLLQTLKGHEEKTHAAVFVPNADHVPNHIITGSHDRTMKVIVSSIYCLTIKVWDLKTGTCLKTFLCLSIVHDLDITAQGNICISAHFDQELRLWDLRSQRQHNIILTTHSQPITSVTLLQSDQTTLLTNSRDNTLKLIDLRMLKEISTVTHEKYMCSTSYNKAAFRPCGDIISVGSSCQSSSAGDYFFGVICWDLRSISSNINEKSPSWCKLLNLEANVSMTQRLSSKTFGVFGKSSSTSECAQIVNGVAWNEQGDTMVACVQEDFCLFTIK